VAALTVGLAEALEHESAGPYARVRFGVQDVQEMRYASLLHDFGKVGVREHVLVKAEKLYPQELDVLRARFALARKDRQLRSAERRLEAARDGRLLPGVERDELDRLEADLRELDETLQFILACNRPSILPSGGFERLAEVGRKQFRDERDAERPLLLAREVERLSIPRGSLSTEERQEIESHVSHTFRFLSQIPWTRALKRVPDIAYAHHERLNGSGYPRKIPADTIPVQSKMMAISDVYDALTAADRPYKKAVPHPAALDILHQEARSGMLDTELLRIFVQAEIPRRALPPPGF
jgi:response regulator RpfG family c-di-GMP phosphodiesterase